MWERRKSASACVCVCAFVWVSVRAHLWSRRASKREREKAFCTFSSSLHHHFLLCDQFNLPFSLTLSLSYFLSLVTTLTLTLPGTCTHTRKALMLSRALLSLLLTHEHICSAMSTIKALYLTLTQAHWWTSTGAHTHMHTHVHTLRRTHTHVHTSRHTKAHTHSHSLSRAISVSFPFFIFSSDERNGWYESWKLSKIRIKSFLVVSSGPFFTRWTSAQIYPLDWSIIHWISTWYAQANPELL